MVELLRAKQGCRFVCAIRLAATSDGWRAAQATPEGVGEAHGPRQPWSTAGPLLAWFLQPPICRCEHNRTVAFPGGGQPQNTAKCRRGNTHAFPAESTETTLKENATALAITALAAIIHYTANPHSCQIATEGALTCSGGHRPAHSSHMDGEGSLNWPPRHQ